MGALAVSAGPDAGALFVGAQNAIDPAFMRVGALCFAAAVGAGPLQVLPAAPSGSLWFVLNGNVQALGTTTWSIREEVPSEPVRQLDRRTSIVGGASQPGQLATLGPLVIENLGASGLIYTGTVFLLPRSMFQRYWLELTNVFQTVPITLTAGQVVRTPYVGPVTPAAFNNGDSVARTIELRWTRGADVLLNTNSATSAGTRTTPIAFAQYVPPMRPGDVLEARTTAAPTADRCFLTGLLQASAEIAL
jgi:hypothetical protein